MSPLEPSSPELADRRVDEDPWLTVPEVSAELKLHPATIRAWIKSNRLAAARAGRAWRVRRSDVERALMAEASPALLSKDGAANGASNSAWDGSRTAAPRRISDDLVTVPPPQD